MDGMLHVVDSTYFHLLLIPKFMLLLHIIYHYILSLLFIFYIGIQRCIQTVDFVEFLSNNVICIYFFNLHKTYKKNVII